MKFSLALACVYLASFSNQTSFGGAIISEFLAINDSLEKDDRGERSDWVEIYNPDKTVADLSGWGLTDNLTKPFKWTFPVGTVIPARGFLRVWASGRDLQVPPLHTNFKLTGSGEYLGLVSPTGAVTSEFAPQFPVQVPNVSYGQYRTLRGYFKIPTPGKSTSQRPVTAVGPRAVAATHSAVVQPEAHEPITVSITVQPTLAPIASVTLAYVRMFQKEKLVNLTDPEGDGIFTGAVPANAATQGEMLRWRFILRDINGITATEPPFTQTATMPKYYGTVIASPLRSELPILRWFSARGQRPSIFFNGQFLDNITVSQRGQNSRTFPKKSFNFSFNPGHKLDWNADPLDHSPDIGGFNLVTTYADKSYQRTVLASEFYRDAGVPCTFSFPVQVRLNGYMYSVAHFTENAGDDFLKRVGLDADGALYKMNNSLETASSRSAYKKTRLNENRADLEALVGGLATDEHIYDHVDLAAVVNYLAATFLISHEDQGHKNYLLYRDSEGTQRWQVMPWDLDLTFGRRFTLPEGYYNEKLFPAGSVQIGVSNRLMRRFTIPASGNPEFVQMYGRRIRTLAEKLLQQGDATGTLPTGRLETRMEQLYAQILPDKALENTVGWPSWGKLESTRVATNRLRDEWLEPRRVLVFSPTINLTTLGIIPPTMSANPAIRFGPIEVSPASGLQSQEYFSLQNPTAESVDLSGWRIGGAVDVVIAEGTVLPANRTLYFTPDSAAFLARSTSPRAGERNLVQGNYKGQLSARGETVTLSKPDGQQIASYTYAGTPSAAQQALRVSQISYNPSGFAAQESATDLYEYVQLKNIGTSPISLAGVRFTEGITFTFPVAELAAGETIYVAKNEHEFNEILPGARLAGTFTGALDNSGERIVLVDAMGEEILDFRYDPSWYPSTNGGGDVLQIADDTQEPDRWNQATGWIAHSPAPTAAKLRVAGNNVLKLTVKRGYTYQIESTPDPSDPDEPWQTIHTVQPTADGEVEIQTNTTEKQHYRLVELSE